jgi:decaprenyl-phosphate phosphoribosyltransferase
MASKLDRLPFQQPAGQALSISGSGEVDPGSRGSTIAVTHYVAIARPDHWVKNVFMLFGTGVALVIHPALLSWGSLRGLFLGLVATCFIASSNYVLNEILDAEFDREHPEKRQRPLASGCISKRSAYIEWIGLAFAGLLLAWWVNVPFFLSGLSLWIMGIVYNAPPIRSKEAPIIDVLSEAINNPIRFLLGWYAIGLMSFPPSSLLLGYWSLGAFFMAGKRFAEFREIGDPRVAARYRKSFGWYNADLLMISMLAYASGFMFFFAVIMTKYHPELILSAPFLIVLMGYTAKLAFEPKSLLQHPERLFTNPWFISYGVLCTAILLTLSVVHLPFVRLFLGLLGPEW